MTIFVLQTYITKKQSKIKKAISEQKKQAGRLAEMNKDPEVQQKINTSVQKLIEIDKVTLNPGGYVLTYS